MNFLILFIVLFGGFLVWGYWESGREYRAKAFVYKRLNETFSSYFIDKQRKIREENRIKYWTPKDFSGKGSTIITRRFQNLDKKTNIG